jgi:hypothetical protein
MAWPGWSDAWACIDTQAEHKKRKEIGFEQPRHAAWQKVAGGCKMLGLQNLFFHGEGSCEDGELAEVGIGIPCNDKP